MLDQHANEPLHAAERGAVDHHGPMRLVVGAGVGKIESLRQLVIDLHGAKLPFAADDVLDDEVDLRAIKRGLARLDGERDAKAGGGVFAGFFGFVPLLGVADVLGAVRIAQADAHAVVVHAEGGEDDLHELQASHQFGGELGLR